MKLKCDRQILSVTDKSFWKINEKTFPKPYGLSIQHSAFFLDSSTTEFENMVLFFKLTSFDTFRAWNQFFQKPGLKATDLLYTQCYTDKY